MPTRNHSTNHSRRPARAEVVPTAARRRRARVLLLSCAAPALLLSPAIAPAAADLASSPPTFVAKWGSDGTGDGQFARANGVAADSSGNVFAADCAVFDEVGGDRIQRFDAAGKFLAKWGSSGSGDGQLNCPMGLTTDAAGNVYVADCGVAASEPPSVQKFTGAGAFTARLGASAGLGCPEDVAVDSAGSVYVADGEKHAIVKLDSAGNEVARWGTLGTGDGQFEKPTSVAIDAAGSIYVADWFNDRVQKLSPTGAFAAKWGSTGPGDGQFNGVAAVTTDDAGFVYAADRDNNRIQKFNSSGSLITKWGSQGTGDGQFDSPVDLGFDAAGNLYVAELLNDRIQKFTYAPAVRLGGKRTQKPIKQRGVGVSATCRSAGCTATAIGRIAVPGAAGVLKLKAPPREIAKDGTANLDLRLKRGPLRTLKRVLRSRSRLKARVTVSALGAAGNPVTARRTVSLRG